MQKAPRHLQVIWRTTRSAIDTAHRAAWVLLLLSLTLPHIGIAAEEGLSCPSRPKNPGKARKLAGALFTDASSAFDDERFQDALKLFLCSMQVIEHPNTLINIEKTVGKLSEKAAGVELLTGFIEDMPDSEFTPKVTALRDTLAEEVEAETEPEATPATVPEQAVEEANPAETPPPSSACPSSGDRARKLLKISGWTNLAIGAGTFVAAIALQGVAASTRNKAKDAIRYDTFLDEKERSRAFQVGATSTFAASALFAGLGIAQLVLVPDDDENDDQAPDTASISLAPGWGWIGVKGAF